MIVGDNTTSRPGVTGVQTCALPIWFMDGYAVEYFKKNFGRVRVERPAPVSLKPLSVQNIAKLVTAALKRKGVCK